MHPWIKEFLMWSFQERTRRVVAMLKPQIEGATLDVGCGNGDVTKHLEHDNIIGLDVYEPPNPRIEVQQFDGITIPFADQTFDTVLCVTALHHVDHPDQLIAEMKRVGKKLVILEDKVDNLWNRKSVLWLHYLSLKLLNIPYDADRFKTRQEWTQFFTQHGLKMTTCIQYSGSQAFWPFLQHYLFVLETA
jgi:ubiquinone/menaquinone biosynthesis C-methylase UbiE